ncbi:tRNA (cytidine(34)-2'-O)-methyltransferase [Vitiosangium sp. GDMCC 1.1324]|uniref:tRNA (cytidine(34)-2'-O)-methyltransferase n=1 Tax=Vitiosangium sp. (strain GDMCC 1.1324) TaxID=2138576 RepID=UPI000D35448A|nr:tRNA (cytidine(34)-2'-O)-methyltransferase [Vitiosangium sp. GDMCC 1.1324]PTL77874.1 tRNA (uridine(34)/cytosine(34)/5-carboxymethylaminomethyluridine(34)-2'-O)-methyltransferase TrmL [Vitiosangium sp. GDMCC 1.1324]
MLQPLARPFHLVLVSPQIPPNTGNIARLCAVTGCRLILVEPLGFSIDDRHLKRAGLDYWDNVFLKLYPDYDAYLAEWPSARRWLFSARAATSLYAAPFEEGDHLVFGSETRGLPPDIIAGGSGTAVTIPMLPERRSLNLSTAVGIATYEALRQVQFGAAAGRAGSPS